MMELFQEKEIDIIIKKAYTLKKDKNIEEGLVYIEDLLEKYPKNNTLYNYKAYWLSYLGKNQEARNALHELIEKEPEKGIYYDTLGEILITLKECEKAIEEFQKAIEVKIFISFKLRVLCSICFFYRL